MKTGVALMILLACSSFSQDLEPCRIEIKDAETGWPVPLVELTTTHHVRFVSDNAGVIAFDLPELMGIETWFTITGHGYGVKKDGFGYEGVRLTPRPGARLSVTVRRRMPAQRLGRITGGGLFGESQRFGEVSDWQEQGILGCDSVFTALHRGQRFWIWGDTTLPGYPLGIFHTLGATTSTELRPAPSPPIRLRYNYFTDDHGRPRAIAKLPGDGPTWLSGLISLPASDGTFHLGAVYRKIRPPLAAYEAGLCLWNENEERFERSKILWNQNGGTVEPPLPDGHPVRWTDAEGATWLYFGDPFPHLKCPATFEAWSTPDTWEKLNPQTQVATPDGQKITPHRGDIAWNAWRTKWVAIFTQKFGKPSAFGELWYAEANHPSGPWENAIKVVTHSNHTFYNPCLHAEFSPEGSSLLYFEATYTREFADHAAPTPRYDYNQVLYGLDLGAPEMQP